MNSDQREIQRKLRVLEHADKIGDVSKTCRYFGIGRASFYRWRKAYADKGEAGLLVARSVPRQALKRQAEAVGKFAISLEVLGFFCDSFIKSQYIASYKQHMHTRRQI